MSTSTPTSTPLRILLVDDHAVVRLGLRNLIQDEAGWRVAGEAASCSEALRLVATVQADVLLLDLRLPDGSGVDIIDRLKIESPGLRILVLTSYADDSLLLAALRNGADGYLLKDVSEVDLVSAILRVSTTGFAVPMAKAHAPELVLERTRAGTPSRWESLTGQERRMSELVGRGHSNREVAMMTGLTEKTVRNYLTRVYAKLGLSRRSELVALYVAGRSGKSSANRGTT